MNMKSVFRCACAISQRQCGVKSKRHNIFFFITYTDFGVFPLFTKINLSQSLGAVKMPKWCRTNNTVSHAALGGPSSSTTWFFSTVTVVVKRLHKLWKNQPESLL